MPQAGTAVTAKAAAEPAAQTVVAAPPAPAVDAERRPVPTWYWILFGASVASAVGFYAILSFERLEIFKMLLSSFFPLAVLILSVLGTIVFGLATPTEAAAIGAFGGALLAAAYKPAQFRRGQGVGLPDGQDVGHGLLAVRGQRRSFRRPSRCWAGRTWSRNSCSRLNMTPMQFMILSQCIIFILGWPLEWTEIIVIFMPIFIPLLPHFGIDPLFFGLLVALNLQTAFLSPPVAMSAFYLKGVAPPHVTLNQIFAGMMPFMGIQIVC
jgi:TRAP-type mannitol/chloroaromatic compound transport system permease large subunit